MSDTSPFGFGRFVPGFDFLQNLAKGAAAGIPGMPALSGWVAPTVSVEELDRRIQELKAVEFWLEQNARALAATVQALEVQKMTLATLQDMNVAIGDLAGAFGAAHAAAASAVSSQPQPEPAAAEPQEAQAAQPEEPARPASAIPGIGDPLQWWGALTSQFQQIAANAVKDAGSHQAAFEAARETAGEAVRTAADMAAQVAAQGVQSVQGARAAAGQAKAAPAGKRAAKQAAKPRPAARKTAAAAKKPAAPRARRAAG